MSQVQTQSAFAKATERQSPLSTPLRAKTGGGGNYAPASASTNETPGCWILSERGTQTSTSVRRTGLKPVFHRGAFTKVTALPLVCPKVRTPAVGFYLRACGFGGKGVIQSYALAPA